MSDYIALTCLLLLTLYVLGNGLYAVIVPAAWLRARWSATRGIRWDPSSSGTRRTTRILGLFMLAAGTFLFILSCRAVMAVIHHHYQ
jgi:hypothetical protein